MNAIGLQTNKELVNRENYSDWEWFTDSAREVQEIASNWVQFIAHESARVVFARYHMVCD